MKKLFKIGKRKIHYYSINLCSHDDVGDYELFPAEKVVIDIKGIVNRFREKGNIKYSSMAAQFVYKDIKISIYSEGRVILEGIKPDSHEAAFRFLEEILQPVPVTPVTPRTRNAPIP